MIAIVPNMDDSVSGRGGRSRTCDNATIRQRRRGPCDFCPNMLSSAVFDRRVPCREPACSERRGARSGSRAAAGLAAIGVRNFIVSDFVTELQPVPAGIPARTIMACLNGAAVLAAIPAYWPTIACGWPPCA